MSASMIAPTSLIRVSLSAAPWKRPVAGSRSLALKVALAKSLSLSEMRFKYIIQNLMLDLRILSPTLVLACGFRVIFFKSRGRRGFKETSRVPLSLVKIR